MAQPTTKCDTVLQVANGTSATADISQMGTDLTSSGGGAYLSPSANTAIDGSGAGREISFRVTGATYSSGCILYHGSTGGTVGYKVTAASGVITFAESSGTVTTFDMPGVTTSTNGFECSICTRPNPLTTGASDAMVTEVYIKNTSTGDVSIERATHALGTISASDVFSYDGQWDGATMTNGYTYGTQEIRVGGRFKSTTESAIDWGHYTPSTPTAGENLPDSIPAFDADSDIGDGGVVAGPAYAIAGAMVGAAGRRMLSPLVNDLYINGAWQGWDRRCSTSIVSEYDVELTTGASTANPGHGTGVSGTPEICRTFDSSSSQYMEYDGVPGFISDLQGTIDYTITCWVKMDSIGSDMVVMGLTGGGTGGTDALNDCAVITITSSGSPQISWHSTGQVSESLAGATTLSADTWYHLAFTFEDDGGGDYELGMYVNGTSVLSETYTRTHPAGGGSSTWQVGRRDNNGTDSEYFDGSIGEWCLRGRLMTSDEIASEAARGQGHLYHGNPIDTDDTQAHWKFRRPSNGYMPARAFMDVGLGGDTYKAHLDTLTKRPVPLMAGRICGRVLAGVDSEGAADAVKVAIVATNRQPGKVTIGGPPAKTVYATGTITAGRDELLFDDLDIPRDADDCCWFYLASRINAGSPGDNTAIQMQGCQVIPYSKTLSSSYPLPFASP